MNRFRICVNDAMIPFNYALNSCTINPAKLLRIDDRKGKYILHFMMLI